MRILVDTSAWVALEDHQDGRHGPAASCWEGLADGGHRFLLSTWIFEETMTLLARRSGGERAYLLGRRLLDSPNTEIVRGDPVLESQAMLVMRNRKGPSFSFTDAASWAIVRSYGIDAVFAFDRHLRIPGILSLPDGWPDRVGEKPGRYRAGRARRRARISSRTARHSSSEL